MRNKYLRYKDKEIIKLSQKRLRRNLKKIDISFISKATQKKMMYWEDND